MRSDEEGQALIESILLGLLLLVPIVWGLMVLTNVHRAALASTSAAREAGFDAVRSIDLSTADESIEQAARLALENHGLDSDEATVRWSAPRGLARGATVEVRIGIPVRVMRLPFTEISSGPSVWIRSTHVARVDPFASR
jgi:hypothetical protein